MIYDNKTHQLVNNQLKPIKSIKEKLLFISNTYEDIIGSYHNSTIFTK